MFILLIILIFNFNKKKLLFNFKIIIFEFVSRKFSTLQYRKKRIFIFIFLIFNILFLIFNLLKRILFKVNNFFISRNFYSIF